MSLLEIGTIVFAKWCHLLRLFLPTTFPKIFKNSIFLLNLQEKFQNNCDFRPNARKFHSGLNLLRIPLYQCNPCNSRKKMFANFQSFLRKFPNICVFRPNARKFNTVFKFFEKSPKIMHFCNFPNKSFENLQNFYASSPYPLGCCPLKSSPNLNPSAPFIQSYLH